MTMSDNDNMDDEDKALFRKACRDVKPLKGQNRISPNQKKTPYPPSQTSAAKKNPQPNFSAKKYQDAPFTLYPEQQHDAESTLCFIRDGIQDKLAKRLRKGQLSLDATLDLHGQTSAEAFDRVNDFINQAQQNNWRQVLIIHGKGYHSQSNSALLKSLVFEWLKEDKCILACHSAQPKHGGTGAMYALIKRMRNNT